MGRLFLLIKCRRLPVKLPVPRVLDAVVSDDYRRAFRDVRLPHARKIDRRGSRWDSSRKGQHDARLVVRIDRFIRTNRLG